MSGLSIAWAEQFTPWFITLAVSAVGYAVWAWTHRRDTWQDRADDRFAEAHRVDLSSLDRRDGVGERVQ